jgi:hypothetical protein
VRTVIVIAALPAFIFGVAYVCAPIACNLIGAGSLDGEFGFKLGWMVFGTWLILTFYYLIYCIIRNFIKRELFLYLLWILFLLGPPLYLTMTSRYDFSVNRNYFLFNAAFYVGHAALTHFLNRIPFTRVGPAITSPEAVNKSTPG